LGRKALFSKYSLLELTTKAKIEEIVKEGAEEDDSKEIAEMFGKRMVSKDREESNVCFMDMRAEKVLAPEDLQKFEFLIFGGILGDHPPQDKPKELRANFKNLR
jgi:ribosome biogenesis SPOUT family RNA methylase Rps3